MRCPLCRIQLRRPQHAGMEERNRWNNTDQNLKIRNRRMTHRCKLRIPIDMQSKEKVTNVLQGTAQKPIDIQRNIEEDAVTAQKQIDEQEPIAIQSNSGGRADSMEEKRTG